MEVRPDVSGTAPRHQAFYHRSQASSYKQGLRNICHARPGEYYISEENSPPNPSLMREQIRKLGRRSHPKD